MKLRPAMALRARNRSVPPVRLVLRYLLVVVAVQGLALGNAPVLAADSRYSPVTAERLLNPEPRNWPMYRRTYDGWGYSPLDRITPANVASLEPVWTFSTGSDRDHQSPPIVNDGHMFVTTPLDTGGLQVLALDAATGDLRWRRVHDLPADARKHRNKVNRGVALYGDKVFVGTADAAVVALDAVTGAVVWERRVADPAVGHYVTMAPLAVDGKVMVGVSGGGFGIRGFVVALDTESGREVWKTHTVPAPGEPGSETWSGETWRTGGAPVWVTATYDPALNQVYWGTGNPGPWMGDVRPGDNLYTNSVLALDAATGAIAGYHQYHHNGSWDWDEADPPLVLDVERDGRTIPSLVHPGRNGYLWLLERSAGGIGFVDAVPYVHQNVFTAIDARTGRPSYDPARVPGTGRSAVFCPSHQGAKNWQPAAFNPTTAAPLHSGQREPVHVDAGRTRWSTRRESSSWAPGSRCGSATAPAMSASSRRGTSMPASGSGAGPSHRTTWGPSSPPPAASSSWAGPATATSAPSTPSRARSSGDSAPTRASSVSRPPSRWTAASTSPCSPAGAPGPSGCRTISTGSAGLEPMFPEAA